ncbi:MAG: transposase [Luteolibacter sp.]|jgi:REP element-mobilizing transposase RayT|nr:transposase [Luteolibacter sp.]
MARPRWIVPWAESGEKPAIYHCISRAVDKRFAFEGKDKEQFRTYMRMYENFSGCRVLSYCLMSNHIHLLLEVPPMPRSGFSDEQLVARIRAIYNDAQVAEVAKELIEARKVVAEGRVRDGEAYVLEIHERFTYRMHDLSEFMKGLMQRFTQWYNRSHERRGNLWEETFKSVVVEDGVASRTVAAYIDLNPVRAGIVEDPADYRWSSYGEATGGGGMGKGKKARAGLVRAIMADKGWEAHECHWAGRVSREYRMLFLQQAEERAEETINPQGELETKMLRKGMNPVQATAQLERLESRRDVALAQVLRWRVRYFTDGAVIGSRGFVDDLFSRCRERFGIKRMSGARKLRGTAAAASGLLWSMRDLRKEI